MPKTELLFPATLVSGTADMPGRWAVILRLAGLPLRKAKAVKSVITDALPPPIGFGRALVPHRVL